MYDTSSAFTTAECRPRKVSGRLHGSFESAYCVISFSLTFLLDQVKVNEGTEQLQKLVAKVPKKSRDTNDQLDAKIQ